MGGRERVLKEMLDWEGEEISGSGRNPVQVQLLQIYKDDPSSDSWQKCIDSLNWPFPLIKLVITLVVIGELYSSN